MASLIMGAWFYMSAVGNFVAGKIGEATGGEGGEMSREGTLQVYTTVGWVAIGVAAAVLALSPLVKKWMHLDTLGNEEGLAGRDQLGEREAAGMFPQGETAPNAPRRD
jgi:POT family proton-dependent oligopeptide transporter